MYVVANLTSFRCGRRPGPTIHRDLLTSQKRLFESSMNGPTPDVPIQDIFTLYRRTKMLLDMYEAFCPQRVFNVISFLKPHLIRGKTGVILTLT